MKNYFKVAASTGVILILALAGCPQPSGGVFISVTNITGIPGTATAGTPLTLAGTVEPGNATNQIITWSVIDPGSTGAAISGNVLTTTAAGTVVVRALIVNGWASGNCTQDFTIIVSGGGLGGGGTLTINGLPSGGTRAVYVFSSGTDISTYDAISSAYMNGSYQAVGASLTSEGAFTLYTWTGGSQGGGFTGEGSFPVLLLNSGGSITDTGNPMYAQAAVTFSNGAGTVSYDSFSAVVYGGGNTVVSGFSLNGKVTAPVKGAAPDTTAINEAQYTGTIAWQSADGTPHTGAFAASTVYTAVVTLTAKSGYTFTGVAENSFTCSGAASITNAANSGTITISFPATGADEPAVVSAFSLDGKVTAPVRGVTPDTTAINEAQYTGTIAWQNADGTPHTGAFAASTVYKAVVTLTAKSGFTLTGVAENSFTCSGAASVTNAANSGTITISFQATAAPGEGSADIQISFDGPVNADITIDGGFKLSKSDPGASWIIISVENPGDYANFRWLVDGADLTGETGNSVTLDAADYAVGAYWLMVIAEKTGVPYSREFSFAVVN
jgi:hypothetical protein